jgi:ArsR family transcriptional regulator
MLGENLPLATSVAATPATDVQPEDTGRFCNHAANFTFPLHISVNADIWKAMRDFSSLGQAIVDPTRVRIIAALRRGELCVCELADAFEISQSTLSGHLQVLRQTGFVVTRKDGRWIYYSLTDRKAALIEALFSHIQPDCGADPRAAWSSKNVASVAAWKALSIRQEVPLSLPKCQKSALFCLEFPIIRRGWSRWLTTVLAVKNAGARTLSLSSPTILARWSLIRVEATMSTHQEA